MTPPRFDGQVAIVTGAGGGLGSALALGLAERGAKVLVNDYGGDTFGIAAAALDAFARIDQMRKQGCRREKP